MIEPYRRTGRLEGSCLCGGVKLGIDGNYVAGVGACHCSLCQKSAGVMWAAFEVSADAVSVTGEVARYNSTPFAERAFCPVCGSNLWLRDRDNDSAPYEGGACLLRGGLVVSIDGKPPRKVVENGIDALKAIWHRGAVDADGKTGDGAGIHVQIPVPFFYDQIKRTGHEPRDGRADGGGPGVPAAHRFRRAGNLPDHRRDRSAADGLLHLWLARGAGEHRACWAKRPTRRGPRSSRS
jgi:hypothetical protein